MKKESDIIGQRKVKVDELRAAGIEPYPNDIRVTHKICDIRALTDPLDDNADAPEGRFQVAGRMVASNRFGKAAFIRFRDATGMMQAYIKKDMVGEAAYGLFRQMDIGDWIAVTGSVFRTRTGEWTIQADTLRLAAKAIRPLPEKFHGLKDPEKRYRRRYVDLIMNADVRNIFQRRSQIVQSIRRYLTESGFIEVETPMMQPIPGGAEAEPFVTHHNALGMDLYLRIAPELYLKRLIVGGLERVFEINRNFRNEGISTRHNPEFTMLEFYQAYATYSDLMEMTEALFGRIVPAVTGGMVVSYQGQTIDFTSPWRRMTLAEALSEIGGVPPALLGDAKQLLALAAERGVAVTKTKRLGKIITKLFDALVEPHLIQPTFITGYPVEVSPLSRRNDSDPSLTDRFELFIAGCEIANGFSELNDPVDQRSRFEEQVADRNAGDAEAHFMDSDYIEALEYGMPPTAGEGIGIDRLVMLLTDSASIREVILFPQLKPAAQDQQ